MRAFSRSGAFPVIGIGLGVMLPIAVASLLLISALGCGSGQPAGSPSSRTDAPFSSMDMPDFVSSSPQNVQLAYEFAFQRPDVMLWIPCYCGCGGHAGHRNARDCFIKGGSNTADVQFEEHGSTCNVCVDIALTARSMTSQGSPVREIRAAVDEKYKDVGLATDTPLPPF